MHELSIARHAVELAAEQVRAAGYDRAAGITLRIGALTCVHKDALEFSFEVAARGTPLEGARLVIEELPVAIFCAACGETVELPGIQALRCPRCGAPSADVRQGDELELWSLEFSEES